MIWLVIALLAVKYFTDKLTLLNLVKSHAAAYGLNWCVVAGICYVESAFNPDAVGDGGQSIGLMQVQLNTASWIVGREVSADELKMPAFNIDLGCRYLRFQLDRYEKDYDKAIAAYNAGSYKESSPGIAINQRYVLRVRNGESAIGAVSDCSAN